jgi:hypothetical protein
LGAAGEHVNRVTTQQDVITEYRAERRRPGKADLHWRRVKRSGRPRPGPTLDLANVGNAQEADGRTTDG